MDCSTPDLPVHHQLLELAQTHVHRVGDAIQPSQPLPSNLDIRKTSKKVENGLLTITIPIKEEEKPIEIEVE